MPFSVLVVDDDPETRMSLRRILEREGYQVDFAATAAEARARNDWPRYGAVLLDRVLPDGTAEELLPLFRERAPETAVVVITGHADVRGTIEAFRLGAADYVLKPIGADDLRARLDRIVQHRRTREALREREEELRAVLDALPVGVWFTDARGRVKYGNRAAQSIKGEWTDVGCEEQGASRNGSSRLGVGVGVAASDRALARVLRGEKAPDEELEVEGPSGTRKLVLASAVPLRAEDGSVRGAVVIAHDLTERKRAEDARLHFQALFEAAPGMYLVLDPELTIRGASDAYLRATMTTREEIVGRNLFEVFPDDPADPAATGVRNLRASLERVRRNRVADVMPVQRYPIRRPRLEGGGFEERFWSPLNSPVFGPDGRLEYFIHRLEDVTEFVRGQQRGEVMVPQLESRAQQMQAEIYLRAVELARADQARRASEGLFRGAFEDTHVATALADLQGRIQRANAAFDRLFQCAPPPGAAKLPALADITHPDHQAACATGCQDLLAGRAANCRLEARFVRGDGAVMWGLMNLALVRDAQGLPGRFIIQILDVTEQRQAQEALRESERRFRELLEKVELLAVMLDSEARLTFCNDYLLRLTGWRREELQGRSWFDVFVPEERRAELRDLFFHPTLREQIPAHFENEILTRTGERRLVAWNNTLLRDAEGRLIGTTSLGEDITERKRSEDASNERKARLSAILNTAADAIVTFDPRGVIQTVNPATEALFGYSAAEMVGRDLGMLMPLSLRDDSGERPAEHPVNLSSGSLGAMREATARRKDGSTFPIELAFSEIEQLKEYTGIIRDVTRRKELEREVVEVASNEQWRIGQDLHDTVGQELTALNLLTGDLADALQSDPGAAVELTGRLARGLKQCQQQLRVVLRGLLPVPVDREGLMAALADLADRTRADGTVDCLFNCPEPVAVANNLTSTHLYLIAQEAVHNAVKHARPQRIVITLSDGDGLFLEVRDDGHGLPSPDEAKPPGMGLRIMRNRAAIIGASLNVEPAVPAGTVVTCKLTGNPHE